MAIEQKNTHSSHTKTHTHTNIHRKITHDHIGPPLPELTPISGILCVCVCVIGKSETENHFVDFASLVAARLCPAEMPYYLLLWGPKWWPKSFSLPPPHLPSFTPLPILLPNKMANAKWSTTKKKHPSTTKNETRRKPTHGKRPLGRLQ